MKTLLIAAAAIAISAPALAQTNLSVTVGQPGFYGRIDIGDYGRPQVYAAQPVIVERVVRYEPQTVYLRVPEGHRKHWDKHCREYNACGQRVYFVQDGWYNNTYAPRYRETHVVVRDDDRGRDRYRDDDRDDDHGHGNGHGKGHGKGHDKHKD